MTIYGNHYEKIAMYKMSLPDLDDFKSFDVYQAKLKVWAANTPAVDAKLGALVSASLPN